MAPYHHLLSLPYVFPLDTLACFLASYTRCWRHGYNDRPAYGMLLDRNCCGARAQALPHQQHCSPIPPAANLAPAGCPVRAGGTCRYLQLQTYVVPLRGQG